MTEPVSNDIVSQKLVSQAKVRRFTSQNGRGYVSIGILGEANEPIDPDDGTLNLKVYFNSQDGTSTDSRGILILDIPAASISRDDVGKFHYDIGPAQTAQRGTLAIEWTYQINDVAFTFLDNMIILEQMPNYDALSDESKLMVAQGSWFFADLFDSETGGPWLQENFQTHFTYDRIAFLLGQAAMKFNVMGWPITDYGVTPQDKAIPDNFGQLLLWGTKIEVIRHLIASYTEIPNYPNTSTTYTDRRDYADRWRAVLAEEKPDYLAAVKLAKRSLLRLGRGSLLISGGIYGGGARGGIMVAGLQAALTRSMRMYPASPSVRFGNQALGLPW